MGGIFSRECKAPAYAEKNNRSTGEEFGKMSFIRKKGWMPRRRTMCLKRILQMGGPRFVLSCGTRKILLESPGGLPKRRQLGGKSNAKRKKSSHASRKENNHGSKGGGGT